MIETIELQIVDLIETFRSEAQFLAERVEDGFLIQEYRYKVGFSIYWHYDNDSMLLLSIATCKGDVFDFRGLAPSILHLRLLSALLSIYTWDICSQEYTTT